jgi:hypothetical protein
MAKRIGFRLMSLLAASLVVWEFKMMDFKSATPYLTPA